MKKCSTSLITREMQTKTTMRYQDTLVKMTINEKQNTSVGEGVKKLKPLHSIVKMQNDCHDEKQYEDSSKC